ncbi:MAG: hypothetical protein JXA44_09460 [Methanospirillaceae archaeon]|nr:hypothetical protein [Methanospirillaceae archaeon]
MRALLLEDVSLSETHLAVRGLIDVLQKRSPSAVSGPLEDVLDTIPAEGTIEYAVTGKRDFEGVESESAAYLYIDSSHDPGTTQWIFAVFVHEPVHLTLDMFPLNRHAIFLILS